MKTFDIQKLKNTKKQSIDEELLKECGFNEELTGIWAWRANEQVHTDGEIYINFVHGETVVIDAHSITGNIHIGNYYADISASIKDLITTIEILKL